MRDEAFIIEKEREEDRLLLQVRDAARIAADGDAARSREVLDLISGPQHAAESGDLRLCEALGDFYRDAEPAVTGLSRSGATDHAVRWYYKAASASRYPRRGECGMQIALLSFLPKYGNVRFKQAKDWFVWAGGRLGSAGAWLRAGSIAEYEGRYDEAMGFREKADSLSGDRLGEVETACMLVRRGLDETGGVLRLTSLMEDGVAKAAVEIAALMRSADLPDEAVRRFGQRHGTSLSDLSEMLGSFAADPDALAEKAMTDYYCISDDLLCETDVYIGNLEQQDFYKMLETAWNEGDSPLAAYYLGRIYSFQLDSALLEDDFPKDKLADLAAYALAYLDTAAGEGLPYAIKADVRLHASIYGFDSATEAGLRLLGLFGEKAAADEIRQMKEEFEDSSRYFASRI